MIAQDALAPVDRSLRRTTSITARTHMNMKSATAAMMRSRMNTMGS